MIKLIVIIFLLKSENPILKCFKPQRKTENNGKTTITNYENICEDGPNVGPRP